MRVLGKTEKPKFLSQNKTKQSLESALKGRRKVYLPEAKEMKEIPVYDGDASIYNNVIKGPAVIEKINTSIFVDESYDCLVDDYGSFIVYDKEKYPEGFKIKSV